MTYWHMQLHPNNIKFEREVNILQQTNLIGLGDWKNNRGQVKQFSQNMQVGDIVLVKRGHLALALVEVVGEVHYEKAPNEALDWFPYRRKVNILSIADQSTENFPQPRGTLSKSINAKTKTYQYINDWYNQTVSKLVRRELVTQRNQLNEELVTQQNQLNKELVTQKNQLNQLNEELVTHLLETDELTNNKIRPHLFGLFIEKHKMFVDFTLSFVDDKNEPLPVVVLAGINGSGKTTLLEYIDTFSTTKKNDDKDYIEVEKISPIIQQINKINQQKNITKIYKSSNNNKEKTGIAEIRKKIRYFPVKVNSVKDTKDIIIEYANKLIRNNDYRPSEAYKNIKEMIHDIFQSLNLQFSFSRLDEKDQVFFKNESGAEFSIDDLSTGEKTLLSNLFNLYIGDYGNKVILIDEPEISLHPSWQHKIIKLYENFCTKRNSQIIIATHSPQVIGGAKNDALKILSMRNGKIEVMDNLVSYGRDSNWILSKVMGTIERNNLITKEIQHCQSLLVDEKYDKCEICLDTLEEKIGANDPILLQLRNILFFERD